VRSVLSIGLAVACLTTFARMAGAQSPGERQIAQQHFAEGQRAFKAGDYRAAASAFEAADRIAPHHDVLWNAARAWHRAGELARAANLYADYLDRAPDDALDRGRATAALADVRSKVGRIEIHRVEGDTITVDDQPTTRRRVYVAPGAHAVRMQTSAGTRTAVVQAAPGATVSVSSQVDDARSEPARAAEEPRPPPRDDALPSSPPAVSRRRWSPAVVYAGAGLTLVVTGLTVWAGLATLDAREAFDASRTQENLDRGRSLQSWTNAGVAVSAGLAALTGAAALLLVDWRSSRGDVSFVVGPAGIGVRGRL
jgi:tetratricopeptide (TPR) repeat protein